MSFLELRDVSKDFSELVVLRGINLSVATGEKHAIIGPNGAGKTTLFNVISGKYQPSGGTVTFQGKDITAYPPHKRNRLGLSRSFQINNAFFGLRCFRKRSIWSPVSIRTSLQLLQETWWVAWH